MTTCEAGENSKRDAKQPNRRLGRVRVAAKEAPCGMGGQKKVQPVTVHKYAKRYYIIHNEVFIMVADR